VAGKLLVGSLCAYELVALVTDKIPTITRICHTAKNRHPVGAAVVWAGLGVLGYHLLLENSK
jgi:hypothetical protein